MKKWLCSTNYSNELLNIPPSTSLLPVTRSLHHFRHNHFLQTLMQTSGSNSQSKNKDFLLILSFHLKYQFLENIINLYRCALFILYVSDSKNVPNPRNVTFLAHVFNKSKSKPKSEESLVDKETICKPLNSSLCDQHRTRHPAKWLEPTHPKGKNGWFDHSSPWRKSKQHSITRRSSCNHYRDFMVMKVTATKHTGTTHTHVRSENKFACFLHNLFHCLNTQLWHRYYYAVGLRRSANRHIVLFTLKSLDFKKKKKGYDNMSLTTWKSY